MKRLAFLFFGLYLTFNVNGQNYTSPITTLDSIFLDTLPNGLKIAFIENPKIQNLLFRLYFPEQKIVENQISKAVAKVNFDKNIKGKPLRHWADSLGAFMNIYADGFSIQGLYRHKDTLSGIFKEIMTLPLFDSLTLAKAIHRNSGYAPPPAQDPMALVNKVSFDLLYGMGRDSLQVDSLNCTNYFKRIFAPDDCLLVIISPGKPAEMITTLEKKFLKWKKWTIVAVAEDSTKNKPRTFSRKVHFIHNENQDQPLVKITFPFYETDSNIARHTLDLLNHYLGGHPASVLNKDLREKAGFSYGLLSNLFYEKSPAYFSITGGLKEVTLDSSISKILTMVEGLGYNSLDNRLLDQIKKMAITRFLKKLENPVEVAGMAYQQIKKEVPGKYYTNYADSISEASAIKLMKTAAQFLDPSKAVIVLTGNKYRLETEKLRQFCTDSTIVYYDKQGYPVQQIQAATINFSADQIIQRYLDSISIGNSVDSIHTLQAEWEADLDGSKIIMSVKAEKPSRLKVLVSVEGQVVSMTRLNKDTIQLLDLSLVKDSVFLKQLNLQAMIFPEGKYKDLGVDYWLNGRETINGRTCFRIETKIGDTRSVEFYDVESGLKAGVLRSMDWTGQRQQLTQLFRNYQKKNGILFPHTTEISGLVPWSLVFNLKSLKINEIINDANFRIE